MTNATDSPYRVNLDGESTGPDGHYLVWATSWGEMEVEPLRTLQLALEAAHEADDSDYGSFDCIEGPAGIVPAAEVQAWINAKYRAAAERRKERAANDEGKVLYEVRLRHPDGKSSAEWDKCKTEVEARDCVSGGFAGRMQIKSAEWRVTPAGTYQPENERVILEFGEDVR